MKKIFKWIKTHIYVFGLLSNIIPIIGLFVLEGADFVGLHQYQFYAWIFGAIYYTFVWVVAIAAYKSLKKENVELEKRVELLEEKIKELLDKKEGK